jgi:LAO/AO transport system kinase
VVKTVASEAKGITELAAAAAEYESFLRERNLLVRKKTEHWRSRLLAMLRDAVLERLVNQQLRDGAVERYAAEIAEHQRDPYALVDKILSEGMNASRG